MSQTTSAHNEILQGPILSPLIRFALPLMLSLLLQALYGAVDLAVVGKFSSTASTAAVATGSQMMQSVTSLVTGLTMGVTILVGKAVGAGDFQQAGRIAAGQIKLFSAAAILLTGLVTVFAPLSCRWMNVPANALEQTIAYIRICAGGMVFITAYNGISGIFRGLGNSKSPLLFVLIACIVNVFLDLLLVGVFHMDAAGAALATVAAQACSVLFSVLYIRRRPLPFVLTRESFRARGCVLRIAALGAPIALQDFLVNISFLMITSIVNRLGVAESAGIGISEKLFVFLSIIPMAFMSALSTFVAQNMGAGQPERARKSLLIARRISVVFGAGIFLLTFFGGGLLAAIFENDPAVIAATAAYLRGSSLEYLLTPAIFCTLGYFNGMERTPFVMIQGLASAFLVRVPLSYLFSLMPGADMLVISLAVPISAVVNLLACLIYDRHLRRSLSPC